MPDDGQQCDTWAYRRGKHDPSRHGAEDGVIDIKEKDEETGEEEEEGEVEQCRQQRFNNPRTMHVVNIVRKKCTDPCSLVLPEVLN